ncbi:MAG TPA: FixH family protein [Burkholderiales bacterium]|jgi:hypothetical protein|nr:FixH family protein [Burkholderiales bacterium]
MAMSRIEKPLHQRRDRQADRTHGDTAISKPWYKEPWPWLLILFPAAAVVGGFITLAFAVQTTDGFVTADYYKVGLAINQELSREQKAKDLNLRAEAKAYVDNGLLLVHLDGDGAMPAAVRLIITHPTRVSMDQSISLKAMPGGWYQGHVKPLPQARWRLMLEDPARSWRIDGSWNTVTGNEIRFSS